MRSSPGKRQYTETLQIANIEMPPLAARPTAVLRKSIGIAEEIAFVIAFAGFHAQFDVLQCSDPC
ncbi:hypothetical protein, partial [Mesorhizobium sp. P5_C1]